jgi:hypothetical protein
LLTQWAAFAGIDASNHPRVNRGRAQSFAIACVNFASGVPSVVGLSCFPAAVSNMSQHRENPQETEMLLEKESSAGMFSPPPRLRLGLIRHHQLYTIAAP